jgi:hypothetical protein
VDTDVSEKCDASIFRVGMCSVRNKLGYIRRLEGTWRLRSTGRGKQAEPVTGKCKQETGTRHAFLSQEENGLARKDDPKSNTVSLKRAETRT